MIFASAKMYTSFSVCNDKPENKESQSLRTVFSIFYTRYQQFTFRLSSCKIKGGGASAPKIPVYISAGALSYE
jgi:hypothetical protein